MGEVVPEVFCGVATAEYPLGDPLVDIIFGVPVGVSRGVIYAVMEYLFPGYLDAANQISVLIYVTTSAIIFTKTINHTYK